MIGANYSYENSLELKNFFRVTVMDIKKQLNPVMVSNPEFEEQLFNELSYLYSKTLKTNFDIKISDDKNSVSITSFEPVVDCVNPFFRGNNKSFIRIVFSLKEDKLVCDFSQGILVEKKEINKSGIKNEAEFGCKLETAYSMRFFDADGIEYSDNSFSDMYCFTDTTEDVDLRERVLSPFHKPEFNEFKLPNIPIHVIKGKARNTYRKRGTFSVIHSNVGIATKEGYKDVLSSLYACHPSVPEKIRGGVLFAKTNGKDFKFEIVNNYAPDIQKAYEKTKEELKSSLEKSNLKEYSRRTYDALINNL